METRQTVWLVTHTWQDGDETAGGGSVLGVFRTQEQARRFEQE